LRNADPADDASAREVINNLFFSEKRYDLGEVGRYRINKKVGTDYGHGCEGIDKTRYY
jgi:rpoB: DNA-directed RNA polymerase, beta subunit